MTGPYPGNIMPAPINRRSGFTTDPELLQDANPGSYTQFGVTLKPGQGVLLLGTLIKQDPTTKHYVRATDDTAEGILRTTTDTGLDPEGIAWQGNILHRGVLNYAHVSAANSGVNLSNVLNARIIEVRNFFVF
jgi:hypothetical protein